MAVHQLHDLLSNIHWIIGLLVIERIFERIFSPEITELEHRCTVEKASHRNSVFQRVALYLMQTIFRCFDLPVPGECYVPKH